MPELKGISHIDLTVSDCDRTAAWWQDVLGFMLFQEEAGESFRGKILMHPSGIGVTVMTHNNTSSTDVFDERRIGLDHLAFDVTDRDELQRWVEHLDAKGVPHSEIVDNGYGLVLVFRDPDNIQLEFFVLLPTTE